MFGLMKPPVQDAAYRSVYSRCCQFQHLFYGVMSLSSVSYEAVFLYLCGMDAGLVDESIIVNQRCCRLRGSRSLKTASDAELGRFCGAFSVILADAKSQDDIHDSGSWKARIWKLLNQRAVKQAMQFACQQRPSFAAEFHELVETQSAAERRRGLLSLHEYVEPTGRGLALLMSLLPGANSDSELRGFLSNIGFHVGIATVASDCSFDWRNDLLTGNFNPVTNESDSRLCGDLAFEHLYQAITLTEKFFGSHARSALVCRSVASNLCKQLKAACPSAEFNFKGLESIELQSRTNVHENEPGCISFAKHVGSHCDSNCEVSSRRNPKRDNGPIGCWR